MKFFSIDLETTGLNTGKCMPLSIAAVYCDTQLPFERYATFDDIFKWDWIVGEPYALNMNKEIIELISQGHGTPYNDVMKNLSNFIVNNLDRPERPLSFVAAGKNFAFDNSFLKWEHGVKPRWRVLDPGPCYVRTEDTAPPSLELCCIRAGVEYNKALAHTALYDATLVARCLYNFYNRENNGNPTTINS